MKHLAVYIFVSISFLLRFFLKDIIPLNAQPQICLGALPTIIIGNVLNVYLVIWNGDPLPFAADQLLILTLYHPSHRTGDGFPSIFSDSLIADSYWSRSRYKQYYLTCMVMTKPDMKKVVIILTLSVSTLIWCNKDQDPAHFNRTRAIFAALAASREESTLYQIFSLRWKNRKKVDTHGPSFSQVSFDFG